MCNISVVHEWKVVLSTTHMACYFRWET